MNLAGANRWPVVFVCENNGLAISVPLEQQMGAPVAARAAGYGMPGTTIDGTDAVAVHAATATALARARAGDGPSLLELVVPRIVPHSSQDDDRYRTDDERAALVARDPLTRLRRELLVSGAIDDAGIEDEQRSVKELVRADLDRALTEPEPEPERARRWLYAS